MARPSVELVTIIDAPPDRVFAVLADLVGWNEWNPTLFDVDGRAVVGRAVRMTLQLGPLHVPMHQVITAVEPPGLLTWDSQQMVPAVLFDVHRTFRLEPVDAGTRLLQREEGLGLLAPLAFGLIGGLVRQGYAAMSTALARRVAAGAVS